MDPQAFWEDTYKKYSARMVGLCYRYVQDKRLAQDLMHDAFMTAMNKADQYKGKGKFESWLLKIAATTALMHIRSLNKQKKIEEWIILEKETEAMQESDSNSKRAIIERTEFSKEELLHIVNELPVHHRLVFQMYVVDNFTHKEIADQLNISPGTSKSHLARARKKLQEILYEKALEQKPEEKERKRLFIIPIFFGGRHAYIDKKLRSELQSVEIPLEKEASFISNTDWNAVQTPAKQLFYTTSAFKTGMYIASGITIVATSAVLFIPTGDNEIPREYIEVEIKDSIQKTAPLKDTLSLSTIDTTNGMKTKLESESEEPIVIRKTVLRKKTVVVIDSVNSHPDSVYYEE